MILLHSYAKINLNLQVMGLRPDNFHEINSIMQSVSLYDEVELAKALPGTKLAIDNPAIPKDNRNTAYRAAEVFFDRVGIAPAVTISIKKRIPVGAGLAGGSSNAAAVLIGLNTLYGTKLTESDLVVLAAEIGSDVPFCIIGGLCRCRGRGEVVEKIHNTCLPAGTAQYTIHNTNYILVKPEVSISTKWVYENFKMEGTRIQQEGISLFNDLEKVVLPHYPQVREIKERLVHLGCLQALMSGSGSAVFGLAPDKKAAQKIYDQLNREYKQVFMVEPVDAGVKIL